MRMIKDYRAITNRNYRIVCNVVIPACIGLIVALIDIIAGKTGVTFVLTTSAIILITIVEVMADYWGFGAICVKGCLGMDYLKTSTRGKAMLQHALMADLLVRPVRIAICMVIVAIPHGMMIGNPVKLVLLSIFVVANVSVWILNITRYFQNIQVVYTLAMLLSAGAVLAVLYVTMKPALARWEWFIIAGCVLLLAAGIYVTSRHMYRKVEMSYRDID